MAGASCGSTTLKKRLPGVAAQVQRGVVDGRASSWRSLGADVEDDIRQAEGDVGDEQGGQAEALYFRLALPKPRECRAGPGDAVLDHHEQQHQRNAGDDLGVDDGHVADVADDRLAALAHGC